MPRITNPMGATGNQVAANIKRLRGSVQYKELSEQLAAIGRPMTPVAIRDAENGKRRVDVDDLMAFAIVFGVSPLTLLLPESGSTEIKATVTGRGEAVSCNRLWLWACGRMPLPSVEPITVEQLIEREERYRERAVPSSVSYKQAQANREDNIDGDSATDYMDSTLKAWKTRGATPEEGQLIASLLEHGVTPGAANREA